MPYFSIRFHLPLFWQSYNLNSLFFFMNFPVLIMYGLILAFTAWYYKIISWLFFLLQIRIFYFVCTWLFCIYLHVLLQLGLSSVFPCYDMFFIFCCVQACLPSSPLRVLQWGYEDIKGFSYLLSCKEDLH